MSVSHEDCEPAVCSVCGAKLPAEGQLRTDDKTQAVCAHCYQKLLFPDTRLNAMENYD